MRVQLRIQRKRRVFLWVLFIFGILPVTLKGEITCIGNPTPTHVEKKTDVVELVKVGEIPYNLNEEFAQALPTFIVGDNEGNIFVFDYRNKKIFKFDKNYRLIKTFGKQGTGTGELGTGAGYNEVYFSGADRLYVTDISNKKILEFDGDGKHLKDYPFPPREKRQYCKSVFPLVTSDGGFYGRSDFQCTLDAYNIHDKEQKKRYSLLGLDDCSRCIMIKPSEMDANFWTRTDVKNTFYDLAGDGRLLVYMANASTLYIFKNDTLVKQFNIWPKDALELYGRTWREYDKDRPAEHPLLIYMFRKFFMDKDDENHFYLEINADLEKKPLLYGFDLEGNLEKILAAPYYCYFLYKKNNLFYARARDHIAIFKAPEPTPGNRP